MSNRQRVRGKTESPRLWPEVPLAEIEARIEALHIVNHMLGEYMSRALTENLVPDEQKHMLGAHFTVGMYSTNRLMDVYQDELKKAEKEINLTTVTRPGLVDAAGNPLRKQA